MKPSKEAARKSERRTPAAERKAEARQAAPGEPGVEAPDVGAAMVDALEDILQWERASERALRVAAKVSDPKLSN